MEIKILQVFYGKDGLPYKDKDRQVHFPITGTGFLGASNTTQIKFYYDELDNLDETTWVAVSKLPNGKLGSRVLESYLDEELNEHYALLELDNYYTQYKGDVFISLQGYQGGVDFDYDEENSQYEIHGTPTIAATGSIKFTINYANQFVGSGQTDNINFQRILAALGTKLGMRAYSEHVEELPSEGSPDVFYVINDDPFNPNLANIYVWNENTRHYIWVGDNTLDLGEYYTREQGEHFENNIDNRVTSVENELSNVVSGSPKGVYSTLADLQAAYPTGTSGIFVVVETGNWYYWNGTAWTSGGVYLSSSDYSLLNKKINAIYPIDINYGTLVTGQGVGSNGAFFNDDNTNRSGYIEVKHNSKIKAINISCRGGRACCVYDENQTFIKALASGTGEQTEFDFVIPTNAKYIVFSCLGNQQPTLFYEDVVSNEINDIQKQIDNIFNSLYTDAEYFEKEYDELLSSDGNYRGNLYFYGIKHKTGGFKVVNSSSIFYINVEHRVNGGSWITDNPGWLEPGTNVFDVNQFDDVHILVKKSDNSLITSGEFELLVAQIKLYIGLENYTKKVNNLIDLKILNEKFIDNKHFSPAYIAQQDATINLDGSITISAGGFYFAYYQLNNKVKGDVAVRFNDGGSSYNMQVGKASSIGSVAYPYYTMNKEGNYKYIVLSKDLFDNEYPYLCVRIDNRDHVGSYTFSELSCIDTEKLEAGAELISLYVSSNGNDNNDGKSTSTALATVDKALMLGASTVLILEGTYNQQINVSLAGNKNISIKNATYNGRVIFKLNESVLATSETQTSGYTKVYQFTTDKTFHENNLWLFQENVPDATTLISDAERNALQRGYEYRCEDTKIVKCSSNNLSDALSEIENADSNVYKWYKDGTTIYFSRPHSVNSDYPICASFGKSLFTNTIGRQYSLNVVGIESKYLNFALIELNCAYIADCKVTNIFSSGAFIYDRCLDIRFLRCEAARTVIGPNGDGFNGHSNSTGSIYSKQTTCTLIDCWSHDNNDDGYSDHERSEITIIGGLYEYNGKAGLTPSYGSHCTCYNVYSRKNYCGFLYGGAATQEEGGKYGQMTCFYCLAENNNRGGSKSGFDVNGDGNSLLLIGCKSIGHESYGYRSYDATNIITMIDCSSLNDANAKGGSGTFTIKNTTLVQ